MFPSQGLRHRGVTCEVVARRAIVCPQRKCQPKGGHTIREPNEGAHLKGWDTARLTMIPRCIYDVLVNIVTIFSIFCGPKDGLLKES